MRGASILDVVRVRPLEEIVIVNEGGLSERHGLAVEIPPFEVLTFLGKNERIVVCRIDFYRDDIPDVLQGVARRSVNLRRTAERVCVLHLTM